jgi:hypothetical protein
MFLIDRAVRLVFDHARAVITRVHGSMFNSNIQCNLPPSALNPIIVLADEARTWLVHSPMKQKANASVSSAMLAQPIFATWWH